MRQVLTAARAERNAQEVPAIEGREGILIPKVDTEELGPYEFLQFFRDTLRVNIMATKGLKIGFYYAQRSSMNEFVVPRSKQNPLVLIRYMQSGQRGAFEDEATHEILKEPGKPGDFKPFLRIQHPIGLKYLEIEPANEESLTFHSRWDSYGEFGEVSNRDTRTLGHIATDFIELVS